MKMKAKANCYYSWKVGSIMRVVQYSPASIPSNRRRVFICRMDQERRSRRSKSLRLGFVLAVFAAVVDNRIKSVAL